MSSDFLERREKLQSFNHGNGHSVVLITRAVHVAGRDDFIHLCSAIDEEVESFLRSGVSYRTLRLRLSVDARFDFERVCNVRDPRSMNAAYRSIPITHWEEWPFMMFELMQVQVAYQSRMPGA